MLVFGTVFGGAITTLGATGSETATDRSPPGELMAQNQTEANTTVTFENQTSNGTVVTISQVTLSDGGFVVVHDEELLNGSVLGSVRGVSEYLEAGTHENVEVTLDEPVEESQTLLALAYQDTNDNRTFDFVDSQGDEDSAYTVDNQVVADAAAVTVEGTDETPTTTETTTTEEPPETETPTETTTTTEEPPETDTPTETTTTETATTTETPTETTTTATTTTTTTTETPTETTTTETPTETTTTETTTTEKPTETTTTETPTKTTTTTEAAEPSVPEQTIQFRIDSVQVNEFSFVVGDADDVDRTVVVEDRSVSDRTLRVDLTKILSGASVEESVGEAASEDRQIARSDLQNVRFVFRNVSVRNVEFVVTAPEDVEFDLPDEMMPDTPTETTTTETTTEETTTTETTTEETTTEKTPTETTTTETTTEETPTETTTTETTTTETTPEETPTETTTEETPTETTTAEEPAAEPSLRVASITAPETIVLDEGKLVVNAQVRNPSEQVLTDIVQLRINGTVVEEQRVQIDPGESAQVQYRLDKSDLGLEPGETFLGVLTSDFGKSIQVTVQDAPPENGDDDDDDSN